MAEHHEPAEASFGAFRESFYYGDHADMQFKFLAKMTDADAQDLIAQVLAGLGEAFDTGDLGPLREHVREAQRAAYRGDAEPQFDDAPFTPFTGDLRGAPTLSEIPVGTTDDRLTARHPGYDATTAQRDPGSVFPLAILRDLADEGRVSLAETHHGFTGATSHTRLRTEVAPAWAERFVAEEVDACLLVAT